MKKYYYLTAGLLLISGITVGAYLSAPFIPGIGTALIALAAGLIIRQFIDNFTRFLPGVLFTEKYVLETSIILLGFGLELSKVKMLGAETGIIVTMSFIVLLAAAVLLKRIFKDKGKLFWLLGAGSAICGSAAIGATAPIVKAKEEETGVSLAVINLLGLSGMILLPLLGSAFGWEAREIGILLGGILQSMGHVVGAAYAMGDDIGQLAVVVKMARVAFLFPFLLLVYYLFKKQNASTRTQFPVFILFFGLAVILSQINWMPITITSTLSSFGEILLNFAMAAIGLRIKIRNLIQISGKAMFSGSLIFLVQILFFGLGILLFLTV